MLFIVARSTRVAVLAAAFAAATLSDKASIPERPWKQCHFTVTVTNTEGR